MTNQEMLLAAVEFGEESFAYDLLYLIQTGVVDANAEYQELGETWNKIDAAVTRLWQSQNLLGFDVIDLYGVRINVSDWMLIFARNEAEARGYALNKLGGGKVVKFPKEKMLTTFYLPDSREYKSLIEMAKESSVFPRQALII